MLDKCCGEFQKLCLFILEMQMIDNGKIPEPLLNELIELLGEEKAHEIIIKSKYNYKTIFWKVQDEKFKRKFGTRLWPLIILLLVIIVVFSMKS